MSTKFSVKGQEGTIPSLGLGTATLFNDTCKAAVVEAIRQGYRHIDTALLYNNQEAVGAGIAEAIAAGLCTRADLFVTTKVGFYPAAADGKNCQVHIVVRFLRRAAHPGAAATAAPTHPLLSPPPTPLAVPPREQEGPRGDHGSSGPVPRQVGARLRGPAAHPQPLRGPCRVPSVHRVPQL